MAATSGRDFTISKADTVIAGLRENGVSLDGSPVDVTDKTDSGFRTYGDFSGVKSFEISASGVLDDDVIQDIAFDPDASLLLTDITIEYPDGASLSGDVFLSSVEFTGAHDGENTYSLTIGSSGKWTYTPAVA